MEHLVASEYFRIFCKQVKADDNFEFARAASEFSTNTFQAFQKIWNKFLGMNAEYPISVGIDDANRLETSMRKNQIRSDSLDEIARGCIDFLELHIFPQFLTSPHVVAYLKQKTS